MNVANFTLTAALSAVGFLAALLACLEIGRRLGIRRAARGDEAGSAGTGVVEGAVFALLGLLIAFTFSGAATRFDQRRALIVEEANAIGTAYLRIDLLPAAAQESLREDFRRYVDARLAAYRAIPDLDAVNAELARAAALQQKIWRDAVSAAAGTSSATMLLLPALNQMFDITATRTMATQVHPPPVLFALLFVLALLSALLAGHAMASAGQRRWTHALTFAIALAGAVYVILDMEFPRLGLIRVEAFDQILVDLRQGMR